MKVNISIRFSIERTRTWSRFIVWLRHKFAPKENT